MVWKRLYGHGGFLVPKNSPYKIFFDNAIIKMKDDGRLQRFTNVHLNRNQQCTKEVTVPLGYEKTISIFVIITVGGFISILSLGIEKFFNLYKNHKKCNPIRVQIQKAVEYKEEIDLKVLFQYILESVEKKESFEFRTSQLSFSYNGLESIKK